MTWNVYCDEFGNTGPHLFDAAQPIFLYGFLIISQGDLPDGKSAIRDLYQQERLELSELKSSQLVKTPRGLRRYLRIGEILAGHHARLCVSIVEKRYQACAMIAETYLDPQMHAHAPPQMAERRFRQMFADASYNWLDDQCLKEFLAAVQSDQPHAIVDVGRRISDRLRLHHEDFVSHAANRMELRPDAVFRYAEPRPDVPIRTGLPPSQYLGFHPGLERLDEALERVGIDAHLVCDQDAQYGDSLGIVFSFGQHLDEIPEGRAYGARRQLARLQSCTHASSAVEFGIQLADLATGLVGRLVQAAITRRPLDSSRQAAYSPWQSLLLPKNDHFLMLSDEILDTVVTALFEGSRE